MTMLSDNCRCEIAKWISRAILVSITWTNILASLLSALHAISLFTSTYGSYLYGHQILTTQMLMLSLLKSSRHLPQRYVEEEMANIDNFELKVKLILVSSIFKLGYHGTIIKLNWSLFKCYDFFLPCFMIRTKNWWWFTMSVVTATMMVSLFEFFCGGFILEEFEAIFHILRRSYNVEWKLFAFDMASLFLVKWYTEIMGYVRVEEGYSYTTRLVFH